MITNWYHGENGITYSLFSELKSVRYVEEFLMRIKWLSNKPRLGQREYQIHLFPSFGKKMGMGEPDFIIVSKNCIVIGEVETDSIKNLSKGFYDQIRRFIVLGQFITQTQRKKIGGKPLPIGDRKYKGPYRTRWLTQELLKGKERDVFYVVITNDSPTMKSKNGRRSELELKAKLVANGIRDPLNTLGWIGFPSLNRLSMLSTTKLMTNFNLKS